MDDDLSVWTAVEQAGNKGVVFVDKKYSGRVANVVDADDNNRPGENTIFGPPHPEYPDQTKEIKRENDHGVIEMPLNWVGRQVHVFTV
jgi:hypothetical protein